MSFALLTFAFFTVTGVATAAVLRLRMPRSRLDRVAYAFLIGVASSGLLLYVLALTRVPIVTMTIMALATAAVLVLMRWREAPREQGQQVRAVGATAVLSVPLLVILAAASVLPVRDYDGRVTWLPKARAIALHGGIDAPYFHGEGGLNLHNRYPILIPLDAAAIMIATGDTTDEAARFLYALLSVAALLVMRHHLTILFPRSGPWVAAAVAWLPVLVRIEGGALAAYNDVAVMAFTMIVTLTMMRADADHRAVALFLSALLLTKNEGAAITAMLVLTLVLTRWPLVRRGFAAIGAGLAIAAALLLAWRVHVPPAYDEQYNVLISQLPRLLGRLPDAAGALVASAVRTETWGFFWPAVAAAAVIVAIARRRVVIPPALVLVAVAGTYVAALTVTSWDIRELAGVAADRLLLHLLGPACAIVAAAVEPGRESLESFAADAGGAASR